MTAETKVTPATPEETTNNAFIRARAIRQANSMIESWTTEELKQYAFDRLTDELIKKLKR
jgi:hypothetical protein